MVGKTVLNPKIALCGTLFKSVSSVRRPGTETFLESVYFHSEMLVANNFGLVLGDYLVNVMIFIKKYIIKLFRISFYELLKIPIMTVLASFLS